MTRTPTRTLVFLLFAAVAVPCANPARAQLLSPAEFLGYELGEHFTPHHRVVEYVQHVADNAAGVVVEEYGRTYEQRPLLLAFVATPDNIARLDEIRQANLARAGAVAGAVAGAEGDVAIVWLSYNVHGNESVSTEAAMKTLYELADPTNERTQAWLRNTVVILDPCINPDGRERYVSWYNRTAGAFVNAGPDDWTHDEPWPGGRTNHYYFDLNRDWSWASQKETRQRLEVYNAWMPHVHVDFHEQGINDPYYFAPAAEPFHEDITAWQRSFQTEIGRNHARYFDENGWLYFTRQRFDLFYPGYGDTWPTYNGAIGMTYEQGGSGGAGLAVETAEGDTLTLADRIAHHHTTGLSTAEMASRNADELIDEFEAYFSAYLSADSDDAMTFVIHSSSGSSSGSTSGSSADASADASADRIAALAELLRRQGIRHGYAQAGGSITGTGYFSGERGRREVRAGDLVVSTDQPKSTLAKVLLEPEGALTDSVTYDITAWSLPLLYGLDATVTQGAGRLDVAAEPPTPGDGASNDGTPTGESAITERPYAYLATFGSMEDHRFLAALHREGVRVRMAHLPLTFGDRTMGRGTLVITRAGNGRFGDRFDELVRRLADESGRELFAVQTGFADAGADLGSSDIAYLPAPRVAVLGGESVRSGSFGQVWHYFDERLGYPATYIDGGGFGGVDLDDYDVLVLPSGSYGSILTESRLADVRAWVRSGGRLIALQTAARFLAGKEGFGLKMKPDDDDGDDDDDADSTKAAEPVVESYALRERRAVSESTPGAIYLADVDVTHPLAYGLGSELPILRSGSTAAEPLEDGWNVAVLQSGTPISGFAGYKITDDQDGALAIGVEDMGRGSVVYMLDDPLFRGMWHAGMVLFGNAVFW